MSIDHRQLLADDGDVSLAITAHVQSLAGSTAEDLHQQLTTAEQSLVSHRNSHNPLAAPKIQAIECRMAAIRLLLGENTQEPTASGVANDNIQA